MAISDWATQPLELLQDIIRQRRPDILLYAGDDLRRLIPRTGSLLIKTECAIVELRYPQMSPISAKDASLISPDVLRVLRSEPARSFQAEGALGVPVYYIDGNADTLMQRAGKWYIRVLRDFFSDGRHLELVSNSNGRAVLREASTYDRAKRVDNGLYLQLLTNPTFGFRTILKGKQSISIFGLAYGERWAADQSHRYADILLSHEPPFGNLDLSGGGYGFFRKGEHIGSEQALAYVRKYQPRFCICGHVDMWGGEWTRIGRTIVINVAQSHHDNDRARYAVIDTKDWSFEIGASERRSSRRIAGLAPVLRELHRRYPADKRVEYDPAHVIRLAGRHGLNIKKMIKARIASKRWKAPRVIRPLTGIDGRTAFVDIETGLASGPNPGRLWLVGILHKGALKQFEIPSDRNALSAFLRHRKIRVLASWTKYDHAPMRDILGAQASEMKLIDLCQRVRNSVVWWTYGLHELYEAFFGAESNARDFIPGGTAGLLADHQILDGRACRLCPSKTEIICKVKLRNKHDLLHMARLSQFLLQRPEQPFVPQHTIV